MRVRTLVLGLLGIVAYVNRDRIASFLGNMAPSEGRGTGQSVPSRKEPLEGLPRNDTRQGRPRTTNATANPAGERDASRTNPVLESTSGREDDEGAEPDFIGADDVNKPVGAIPRSAITGRHDEGTDANETIDGLAETEELTRHLAEDTPSGSSDREEDTPVFERGRTRSRL